MDVNEELKFLLFFFCFFFVFFFGGGGGGGRVRGGEVGWGGGVRVDVNREVKFL